MASITFTVPDAALSSIQEVCTADGWDGVVPLDDHVQKMVIQWYKDLSANLKIMQQRQAMQEVVYAEASTAFGE